MLFYYLTLISPTVGTKSSRAKNHPYVEEEELGEESNDLKAKIKSESQLNTLESE